MGKLKNIFSKRKDLEKELCRRIKVINELEDQILELWENEEELSSRREREIQSSIAAKERYKKASRDRQMLMKEVQLLEIKLKRALEKAARDHAKKNVSSIYD
ncbi:hypothetical protein OS493_032163 [Desmophyllum pertusum]|uniref:Uncharacterized protein n=1 Tax=Desmophyllum pertusum TaxID=174260 RepID=A0A9X0D8Z1_9CNID|nr:hypothetical protein OS493_032163 [Desmophyllum pertusum]